MVDGIPETKDTPRQDLRPPWGRILAWGGLLVLLVIVAFGLLRAQQGPVALGQPAPRFTFSTFDGQQYSLEELKGKVVLVNFWASWCKPCELEAADLENTWQYYQPRGDVVFLGVAYTDTDRASREYLQKFNITYPNGPDLGTRISHSFRITGVPETYIIDREGVLAYVKLSQVTMSELRGAIDPLLAP